RRDQLLRDRVLDDEGEERLRQEARLERAAAVLVGDTALEPVPDRLDDRDADVPGLLLHGVDDGLDPLPHDHRLDLDHPTLSSGPRKKPRDHVGREAPSPRWSAGSGEPPPTTLPPSPVGYLTPSPRAPNLRGLCCS